MRSLLHVIAWALVVTAAVALASCGGGGDAYTPVLAAPKCVALQKPDGSAASCPN